MERGLRTIYNLHHTQRLQSKENLSPWTDDPLFSNALLFISFQIVQKRHKGVAHHAFFHFLPTKEPCHSKNGSLIEEGSTHDTPNRENKRCHKTLALSQWRRMRSMDSSYLRHMKHPFSKDQPLLWMWSKVKTFFQVAFQAKKPTLGNTQKFQITLFGKTPCLPSSNTL